MLYFGTAAFAFGREGWCSRPPQAAGKPYHASMPTWTTRELLAWTTQHFQEKAVDSPRVAAEMLLAHVLQTPRLRLYMEPDRPATESERQTFRGLVARAAKHEPVDYLIGKAPFFSLELRVGPDVLVPRPSTETIVEHVLQSLPLQATQAHASADAPPPDEVGNESEQQEPQASGAIEKKPRAFAGRIADVCTGSGAIAVALAKHLPEARFVATDASEAALAVARQNAADHGVADRIDFRQGHLLEPLGDETFDFLLSNPPYIGDAEWANVPPNVKDHEPTLALRGGTDGLDLLRPLVASAHRHVAPGGQALLEFSSSQADAVLALAADNPAWADATILQDHERLPRVLAVSVLGASSCAAPAAAAQTH